VQVISYVNRYGPGMVIYWFGFLETLGGMSKDVLVTDSFPNESLIRLPTGGGGSLGAMSKGGLLVPRAGGEGTARRELSPS
jgi:hypothetical protein